MFPILRCNLKLKNVTNERLNLRVRWAGTSLPYGIALQYSPRYIEFRYKDWARPNFGRDAEKLAISGAELREGVRCVEREGTTAELKTYACTGTTDGKRDMDLKMEYLADGRLKKVSISKHKK